MSTDHVIALIFLGIVFAGACASLWFYPPKFDQNDYDGFL